MSMMDVAAYTFKEIFTTVLLMFYVLCLSNCNTDMVKNGTSGLSKVFWWTNVKCVVIGDDGVGKTCLLISYTRLNTTSTATKNNTFPVEFEPSVFDNHTAHMVMGENKTVAVSLCDTAAREDYDHWRLRTYTDADVVLVCFSLLDANSLQNVKCKWIPELRKHCRRIPFVLVGTKSDLRNDSRISSDGISNTVNIEEVLSMADEVKAEEYVECSALTQEGLSEVFEEAVRVALIRKAVKKKKSTCQIL